MGVVVVVLGVVVVDVVVVVVGIAWQVETVFNSPSLVKTLGRQGYAPGLLAQKLGS